MARLLRLLLCTAAALQASAASLTYGPSSYAPPGAFPTQWYDSYYNDPTATTAQPQPVISDPVLHKVYPPGLTDPNNIPQDDTQDPHPLPPRAPDGSLLQAALAQAKWVFENENNVFANNTCAICSATLQIGKLLSLAAPEQASAYFVFLCEQFSLSGNCTAAYGPLTVGPVLTQVLSNADMAGYDGQMLCQNLPSISCSFPPTPPLNLTNWFSKPKPNPLPPPKTPSGNRLKVLHLSDFHIDPRYGTPYVTSPSLVRPESLLFFCSPDGYPSPSQNVPAPFWLFGFTAYASVTWRAGYATGSEAFCGGSLCCRANVVNPTSPNQTILVAPRYGAFHCDTPFSLAAAALEAIPVLTGTNNTGFAWSIYTGDLVSHDPENQISRDYVTYTETVVYDLLKQTLGNGPVYVTLGNHDSYDTNQNAPQSLGGELGQQFSWNYDHVASLWELEQWLPQSAAAQARSHYGAYSVQRTDGLRIISLNTDFWYRPNFFNYINLTQGDSSGMLRFLTDELQDAEDNGDRVWIIGHVPSGWDGSDALESPSNLFYQIVDRFSPHVIANIFFGHTHEDQFSIYYANNATNISADAALATSWIGPSLTPLTNLNSGFRVYEVDSATFEVLDAHTWRSDVSSYPGLDGQIVYGPTYVYEYSTRAAYGSNITWGTDEPLNATWWHLVTEQMTSNPDLFATFNDFQWKQSIRQSSCTGDCIATTICYMRSGSSSISLQNCQSGS